MANSCEQYYLLSDTQEWRWFQENSATLPAPSRAHVEMLTSVLYHLCLSYHAIACTTKTSAGPMALGSWPQCLKVLLKHLLTAWGGTAPGT